MDCGTKSYKLDLFLLVLQMYDAEIHSISNNRYADIYVYLYIYTHTEMLTNGRPEDARRSGRMSCDAVEKNRRWVPFTILSHHLTRTSPHHSFLFHPPPSVTSSSVRAAATATAREAPARATPARGRRAAEEGALRCLY
jgi:hypothetical protein